MGLSEPQPKRLLRWRSCAFTVYLQNTAILANVNYETLDRVVGMPYFLQSSCSLQYLLLHRHPSAIFITSIDIEAETFALFSVVLSQIFATS